MEQLLRRDISGPKVTQKILAALWDGSQPGNKTSAETLEEFTDKFKEEEPINTCVNFASNTLRRALDLFASVSQNNVISYIDDVGFLSQESHHDDSSILPSFPTNENNPFDHSRELLGIQDVFSDDEDNLQIFTSNEVDEQLADGVSKDPGQRLIDELDRETRELKSLIRSGNYEAGMFDDKGLIDIIRQAQLSIKRKMRAMSNPDKNAEWVSCCPQQSKKTKRFYASKNC